MMDSKTPILLVFYEVYYHSKKTDFFTHFYTLPFRRMDSYMINPLIQFLGNVFEIHIILKILIFSFFTITVLKKT
jgi:hypothetical protein